MIILNKLAGLPHTADRKLITIGSLRNCFILTGSTCLQFTVSFKKKNFLRVLTFVFVCKLEMLLLNLRFFKRCRRPNNSHYHLVIFILYGLLLFFRFAFKRQIRKTFCKSFNLFTNLLERNHLVTLWVESH